MAANNAANTEVKEEKKWTPGKDGKVHIREHEWDPFQDYGVDTWDVIVDGVTIFPAQRGEANYIYVGVNGIQYQIPRGKPQNIPAPLYDRYLIWRKAEEEAVSMIESIRNKKEMKELRRI